MYAEMALEARQRDVAGGTVKDDGRDRPRIEAGIAKATRGAGRR